MKRAHALLSAFVTFAAIGVIILFAPPNQAATPNVAVATPGVVLMPVHLQGQFTGDVTAVARLQLPFPALVLGVSAAARASGGTSPTLTVDVLDDGATILSAPVAVTAGAVAEGVVAAPVIADESVVTIDLAITGTSPTWDDVDVLITLIRN